MKTIRYFLLFVAFLYAAYLQLPALFFGMALVLMTYDYMSEREEYLISKKLNEKIDSITNPDKRIEYMSGLTEYKLNLYFAQQKRENEVFLNVEQTILEGRIFEVHASEEQQKAAAYVYKTLMDFQGKEIPYLN